MGARQSKQASLGEPKFTSKKGREERANRIDKKRTPKIKSDAVPSAGATVTKRQKQTNQGTTRENRRPGKRPKVTAGARKNERETKKTNASGDEVYSYFIGIPAVTMLSFLLGGGIVVA